MISIIVTSYNLLMVALVFTVEASGKRTFRSNIFLEGHVYSVNITWPKSL